MQGGADTLFSAHNICRLHPRPSRSESQGSCQLIALACFTAGPVSNTGPPSPAAPHVSFMVIPLFHGDDQNFVPMPKTSGSVSSFIPGPRMEAFQGPLDAVRDNRHFRPLIFMEQFIACIL